MDYDFHDSDQLVNAFAEALYHASGCKLSKIQLDPHGPYEADAIATLNTPSGPWQLVFATKKKFYPRDVRDTLWRLEGFVRRLAEQQDAPPTFPVLLAEHLSRGARDELRERGIAHFDLSKTLFLKHQNWLINIEFQKGRALAEAQETNIFTGAREKVVHALLQSGGQWLSGKEMVSLSETSGYTVSTVFQELELLGWIESEGGGKHLERRLVKPRELLDAWANVWVRRKQKRSRWHYFCPNPKHLMQELAGRATMERLQYAFTGVSAANSLTPLITHVDVVDIVVPHKVSLFADLMGFKPAEKGYNIVLIERSGASDLFQKEFGTHSERLVSPFIQYLDLLDGRGRNAELAEQLRRNVLEI